MFKRSIEESDSGWKIEGWFDEGDPPTICKVDVFTITPDFPFESFDRLITSISVEKTSEKQARSFVSSYNIVGSTKAIISSTMGYPKWQSGYSSVNF